MWKFEKKNWLIIVIINIFSVGLLKAEVKVKMQEFLNITSKIQPYLLSKDEYLNVKNETEIQNILNQFTQKTQELKNEKMAKNDDMKFRVRQLSETVSEAEQSFKNGFKDYSFWILKSSFNNCYACHTQKSLISTQLNFENGNHKASDFSKADYLFLVRNYDQALPLFEKLVIEYPKNKLSVEDLQTSLRKILFYCVRVLHDDVKSIIIYDKLLKNSNLPESNRNTILAWKKYLSLKKYRIVEELFIKDQKKLEALINEREKISDMYNVSEQKMIVDLETSHFLFKLLEQTNDKKLKPWLLYWAAQIDKNYRTSMFDTTAELYLRECIETYKKDPVAKKCFQSFKEMKVAAFTGARGTELPKSVELQINKYEELLNIK